MPFGPSGGALHLRGTSSAFPVVAFCTPVRLFVPVRSRSPWRTRQAVRSEGRRRSGRPLPDKRLLALRLDPRPGVLP